MCFGARACVGSGFEEGLEDQHGSDLIDDVFAANTSGVWPPGVAERVKMAMGFGRGEALIPKVDGKAELHAEGVCKGLGAGGLRALVAGHVERIADHCLVNGGVFSQDAGNGLEVVPKAVAPESSMEGEERLRSKAEFIRKREPDAPLAHVESQHTFGSLGLIHQASLNPSRIWSA